jgi:hypothetical protein
MDYDVWLSPSGKPIYPDGAEYDFSVEQFTGLLDKNSKEIYEGDILRWMSGTGNVYFDRGTFSLAGFYEPSQDCPGDAFSENATLEVIGNIHENPDLITPTN